MTTPAGGSRALPGQLLLRSALLLAMLAAACRGGGEGTRDPAMVATPPASVPRDLPPGAVAAPSIAGDDAGVAADTIAGIRPAAPPDTGLIVASAAELRELGEGMVIPVQGVRASELRDTFDERRGGGSRPHEALDILAARGVPVLSATAGTLRKKFSSVPGGLMVYAGDPSDRFVLMYGHLDRYADGLVEGQPLARGQVIGYVGTTGNAPVATPHLHFAIARGQPSRAWWRGTPVDPYPLLTHGAPAGGAPAP